MHLSLPTRLLISFALLAGSLASSLTPLLSHQQPAAAQAEELFITVYETALNPAGIAYEINAGADGRLYVSDNLAGEIRSYTANGDNLHIFSNLGAVTDARPAADGRVWFVDQETHRLERLDPLTRQVVYWELPTDSGSGFGTAFDDAGRVWISDISAAKLFRFDPTLSELCSFDTTGLASGGSPYLAYESGGLWFSDFYNTAILRLDVQNHELNRWELEGTPPVWDFNAEGLHGDGAGGVWFADSNTNTLGRLDLSEPAALHLLRYALPQGNGWPVMLGRLGELVVYSGLVPAAQGWLDPGSAAFTSFTPTVSSDQLLPDCETLAPSAPTQASFTNVVNPPWTETSREVLSPETGWTVIPLDALAFPWGVAVQDNMLWVVDNGRGLLLRTEVAATITACKLQDEDGKLETDADQTPLAEWGMALYVDGERRSTGPTGADGCKTWAGLEIGHTYLVEEERRQGWEALLPRECELGRLSLPGGYTCDFVNWKKPTDVYLPLVKRRP